jgi:hypothetical protein
MEAAAQIKEHHADGTSCLYVLKGRIRYNTQVMDSCRICHTAAMAPESSTRGQTS